MYNVSSAMEYYRYDFVASQAGNTQTTHVGFVGLDQSNFNFARDGGSLMPEGWCSLSS